jgi:hypothetical protein
MQRNDADPGSTAAQAISRTRTWPTHDPTVNRSVATKPALVIADEVPAAAGPAIQPQLANPDASGFLEGRLDQEPSHAGVLGRREVTSPWRYNSGT